MVRVALRWLFLSCLCAAPAVLAAGNSTNSITRWPSLQEVLDKWRDTPAEAVTRAAENGDLTAQHYLGYCYAEGVRFVQDSKAGVVWYERAAKGGYLPSANNLGLLYQRGKLVPQDYKKMLFCYHLAADAGLPQAQANLGCLYRDGIGVSRDYAVAREWFERAAEQGHSGAMVELGRLHEFGEGVPKDSEVAKKWFQMAIAKGDALGELNLGLLYEAEGKSDAAFTLYRQGASHGRADAMFNLYYSYWDGRGVAEDRKTANEWLIKAAEGNSGAAQFELAHHYAYPRLHLVPGQIAPPASMPDAVKWYLRAAENNFAAAQCELGLCYVQGKGVEKDEERGLEWIRKAADNGYLRAVRELIQLYARGIGEPRNEQDFPMQLLRRITENDEAKGGYTLKWAYEQTTFRYEYGVGTERDIIAAVQWYCRAALASIEGYSVTDKVSLRLVGRRPVGTYSSDAERPLIAISSPDNGGESDAFLGFLSLYLQAAGLKKPSALKEIAEMYAAGRDVPKNPAKAWVWLTVAAQNGSAEARAKVTEIEPRLTSDELKEARELLPGFIKELNQVASAVRGISERATGQ